MDFFQIDRATEKCLLRFLDNKECWAHLNELQRVKDDPEEILCVVCKKIDQNVVRCPKCGRGYHRKCLEVRILYFHLNHQLEVDKK